MVDYPTPGELESSYPESSRRRLFDLMNLSHLLADSLISVDYKVPQQLATANIELTDYGKSVTQRARGRGVPFNELRMLCLLEMFHADLIDVEQTHEDAIARAIDKQIKDRSLLYPFTSGRLLYDKYFENYADDPQYYLPPDETQKFLAGTPQGIYQYGRWITGPYGLIRGYSARLIPCERDIALCHCSDPGCAVIHRVFLSTSKEADINDHRDKIHKILDRDESHGRNEGSGRTWTKFVNDVADQYVSPYVDHAAEPAIVLIGDALADDELRKLFNYLLDQPGTNLRDLTSRLNAMAGDKTAGDLNRAQLLQLIVSVGNDELIAAIDSLVIKSNIIIPPGEVRRPVINRQVRFGRFGLHSELGSYGVRVVASRSNIAPLRARSLVEQMYRLGDEADREELDWQLREEPSDSLEAKLEHYLQTRDPKAAIGALVLARRSNVVVATTTLGLGDVARTGDDNLVNAILWKLGFSIQATERAHDNFWRAHDSMLQHARRGIVTSAPVEREEIRGTSSTYFTSLETLLRDSLAYTIWALCTDHYVSAKPYAYRPHIDQPAAFDRLNHFGDRVSREERLTEKSTLFPLTRGFGRLSDYLLESEAQADEMIRPRGDLPEWVKVQSLQRFPFTHTMAFLDLLPDCRAAIVRALKSITARFESADITTTRNEWLHGDRSGSAANLDRLREGIEDVREAVLSIEENGFSRQKFVAASDLVDSDGRRVVVLSNSNGRRVQLFGPSPFAWLRLPDWSESQYVMNAARFAEPTECLRFTVEAESEYSKMWDSYPKRPRLERRWRTGSQAPVSSL